MNIQINGHIGQALTLILGVIVGIGMVAGFALPGALVGVWLAAGCLLWLVGV